MTVTSQTNTTLSEIASALAERDHFVIGGHVSPDGDCLCLAPVSYTHLYQLQGASPFSWRSDLKIVSGTSSPW